MMSVKSLNEYCDAMGVEASPTLYGETRPPAFGIEASPILSGRVDLAWGFGRVEA